MQRRIELLGRAFVGYGVLVLVGAAGAACVCLGFAGALLARGVSVGGVHDEKMAMAALFYLGAAGLAAGLGAGLGLPCVVVGTGLRLRRPWAHAGGLVCAGLTLSHVPLGTVLAAAALATLLDPRVRAALEGPG